MNLLFITHARLVSPPYGDGSTRYRSFNIAEVAQRAGHRVRVKNAASVTPKDLASFDLVSWLRPVASQKLFSLIGQAKKMGIICIADLDDLIVDPSLAEQSPAVVNRFAKVGQIRQRFANHATAVHAFDAITVSTDFLRERVGSIFPELSIATVHNGLSEYWLQHVEALPAVYPPVETLGYLPGSRSHDNDFASVLLPLTQWLTKCTSRQLNIVGKLSITGHRLPAYQVKRAPWVDYFSLPEIINQQNATMAPLSESVFNQAKSHVKFIEAAALGVPTIATPIADIAQHNTDGLLLPSNTQQWLDSLELAVEVDFRREHARALEHYALEHCTATHYATPLINAWAEGRPVPDMQSVESEQRAA
jgi:hypothetical protein